MRWQASRRKVLVKGIIRVRKALTKGCIRNAPLVLPRRKKECEREVVN